MNEEIFRLMEKIESYTRFANYFKTINNLEIYEDYLEKIDDLEKQIADLRGGYGCDF